MAFTCRTEERHEQALIRICGKCNIKTKQKALLHVLDRFEQVSEERDRFARRVSDLESELFRLKSAICQKVDADQILSALVGKK